MPARLYHERIAQSDAAPDRWLVLTHGIYGAGSNWRSIARKVNDRRPEWGVVLVDLRQHGRSEAGAPPHTLAACAEDLRALIAELGGVRAIAGHSFGGKVALAARSLIESPGSAGARSNAKRCGGAIEPNREQEQTWVLDASPSRSGAAEPPGTVMHVLEAMERAPRGWARRDDFVAAFVGQGHDESLARWLAMSLAPEPSGTLALRFDFAALREMLADYRATDLWDALEAPGGDVEVVAAERSSALSSADLGRLAAAPPHVHIHRVDAGHWLHIDAPAAIVELFAAHLP